jgi:hypothetical protein
MPHHSGIGQILGVELFQKTNSHFSQKWNLKPLVRYDVANSAYFAPSDEAVLSDGA